MNALKVGLLGFGTVGTGVVRVFQKNSDLLAKRLGRQLELVKVVDLDTTTDRGVVLAPGVLSDNVEDVISNPDIDIVIELIGGYEPAKAFILKAIANGKHIVTANKALMAVLAALGRYEPIHASARVSIPMIRASRNAVAASSTSTRLNSPSL